jgi:hypothetical protein
LGSYPLSGWGLFVACAVALFAFWNASKRQMGNARAMAAIQISNGKSKVRSGRHWQNRARAR